MSGNATGRFFGPTANEIGGTFYLTGAGGNFIGAFGGK
ncbi:MAG: transferrin-binding protein-like solute binding protein [Alphaproteobacteria bacterium]